MATGQPQNPNASPDRSYGRREYHAIRQRLHGARIEDNLAAGAARLDDVYADHRYPTRAGYSAVQATLSGLPHELRWLLEVSRHKAAATGRLTDCGPRSHALRCQLVQNLRKRQLALVVAEAQVQIAAYEAKRNARPALAVAA